jgi:hypothetical protein
MKRWIALLAAALLAFWQGPAQAQARNFSQAELDALLAPVALYPDSLLSHILVAATQPDEVREAAAWSRANPHLAPEQAVAAAEPMPWHPSVKALVAFQDLLERMDESPQWTADLGVAYLEQEPYVMDTVQALRRRAQASGALQSTDQYRVYEDGTSIAVYPVQPQVVYVPYYNPHVVYGPWWWPSYRPVYWRPWHARAPVHVSRHFFVTKVDWHRRHVVRHHAHHPHWQAKRPVAPATIHNHAHPVRPIVQGARVQAPRPVRIEPPRATHLPRSVPRPAAGGMFHNKQHMVRPIVQSVPHAAQVVQKVPHAAHAVRAVPHAAHAMRSEHRRPGHQHGQSRPSQRR